LSAAYIGQQHSCDILLTLHAFSLGYTREKFSRNDTDTKKRHEKETRKSDTKKRHDKTTPRFGTWKNFRVSPGGKIFKKRHRHEKATRENDTKKNIATMLVGRRQVCGHIGALHDFSVVFWCRSSFAGRPALQGGLP
jgi:hypothetical protein